MLFSMSSEALVEKVTFDQRLIDKGDSDISGIPGRETTGTKALRKEGACLACLRSSLEMTVVGRK